MDKRLMRCWFRVGVLLLVLVAALPGASLAESGTSGGSAPDTTPVMFPPIDPQPPEPEVPQGHTHRFDLTQRRPLRADDVQSLQTIFPPDDRVRVTPTTAFPAAAHTYIEAYNENTNQVFTCSGAMIAPNVVLTAAHCIYIHDIGGWPTQIAVVPGKDGDVNPFGFDYASDAWVPDGWVSTEDTAWDWGLIKLPSNIGDTVGWLEIGILSTETLRDPNLQPVINGYPTDKPLATQWSQSEPAFLDVDENYLYSMLDAYPGQSGSPVRRSADNTIVGVLFWETQDWNVVNRASQRFLDDLLNGCGQMECSFAYYIEGEEPPPPPGPIPTFGVLSPAPFTTVAPGTIEFNASASSDSSITHMELEVAGQTFTADNNDTISGVVELAAGVHTAHVVAVDEEADSLEVAWDIVVTSDPNETEWFTSTGEPKADEINATMRSLVEAFRWHFWGYSWDGASHPGIPTHLQ